MVRRTRPGISRFRVRFAPRNDDQEDPELRSVRQRIRPLAKRALHHHGVEPAAELEADIRMGADHLKSAPSVHTDRSGVGGIADHRDHLAIDRKSTRLNSSHANISYAVFCLTKKT